MPLQVVLKLLKLTPYQVIIPRYSNAMCDVTGVAHQVLLSTSGLSGEVSLGWEGAAVSRLFATTSIWIVSERVVREER